MVNVCVMRGCEVSYGLCDEVVPKPGSAGPDAALASVRRQQVEQFVAEVIWVSDNPVGLLHVLLRVKGPP